MSKDVFTEGKTLSEVIKATQCNIEYIIHFNGKVRGLLIDGVKVFFPKGKRSSQDKLDVQALSSMVLSGSEDDDSVFFLRENAKAGAFMALR